MVEPEGDAEAAPVSTDAAPEASSDAGADVAAVDAGPPDALSDARPDAKPDAPPPPDPYEECKAMVCGLQGFAWCGVLPDRCMGRDVDCGGCELGKYCHDTVDNQCGYKCAPNGNEFICAQGPNVPSKKAYNITCQRPYFIQDGKRVLQDLTVCVRYTASGGGSAICCP
jgi:hypothetical protein